MYQIVKLDGCGKREQVEIVDATNRSVALNIMARRAKELGCELYLLGYSRYLPAEFFDTVRGMALPTGEIINQ
ncbi:MAG: hypothetical protein IKX67_07370 [Bacteroidales bacterium]|nr:hypothetical protein [Bacteroidales bacterium]